MSSVGHNMLRWFRGAGEVSTVRLEKSKSVQPFLRHSAGLAEFMRRISGEEKLSILDLGQTSHVNIPYLIQRGIRVFNEDLLRAFMENSYLMRREDGVEVLDTGRFFLENVNYPENQFDAILCWDIADYLPEPVVKPLIEKIHSMLKPGGIVLAFFHTKDAGQDAPYFRYHILQNDTLELASGPSFRLQRVFNNRHIETLFKSFSSLKFFLGRDQMREVLIVR